MKITIWFQKMDTLICSPFQLNPLLALMFLCWDYLFKGGVFIPLPLLCYLPTLSSILCCHSSTFSTYLFQVQFASFKFCEILQVPIATLHPSFSLLCEMFTLSLFHCWYIPPNPFYIGFGVQKITYLWSFSPFNKLLPFSFYFQCVSMFVFVVFMANLYSCLLN
jgi:hypothetical protein